MRKLKASQAEEPIINAEVTKLLNLEKKLACETGSKAK